MFLTKKHLSRRTVLKAAGVSLGLPLLDAMIPAHTALAQTAVAPRLRDGKQLEAMPVEAFAKWIAEHAVPGDGGVP